LRFYSRICAFPFKTYFLCSFFVCLNLLHHAFK
jgi:hypothetical protein